MFKICLTQFQKKIKKNLPLCVINLNLHQTEGAYHQIFAGPGLFYLPPAAPWQQGFVPTWPPVFCRRGEWRSTRQGCWECKKHVAEGRTGRCAAILTWSCTEDKKFKMAIRLRLDQKHHYKKPPSLIAVKTHLPTHERVGSSFTLIDWEPQLWSPEMKLQCVEHPNDP